MWLESDWLLTPYRAVVHKPTATGVIADLHLGYAAARQTSGEAVPDRGEELLRQRVLRCIEVYGLKRLIIAGDLAEQGICGVPSIYLFVTAVRNKGVTILLVPGNHDRGLSLIPGLERVAHSFLLGDWLVIHQAEPEERRPCIEGHGHPVVRSAVFAGQVPCYLRTERRLMLPAQSDDAGGGSVLRWKAWQQAQCHAIVNDEVLALGTVANLRRRLKEKA
jgi:putative SbcD/Mre11-related phosphoesterase